MTAAVTEILDARTPVTYVWSYEPSRDDLRSLYDKAKQEQWDGRTLLPWHHEVDPEAENLPDAYIPIYDSPIWRKLSARNVREVRQHQYSWMMSQFLHGEQGALLGTSQLVVTMPLADARCFAATQVIDEARHVEVFERYLREKLKLTYAPSRHLRALLDQILTDSRWDVKLLGMQILVEGLALASFRMIHNFTCEPLAKDVLHNVMRDEARHVAFGVRALEAFYADGVNERELRERQEFTYEACRLMRDRFLSEDVWQNLGLPMAECLELSLHSPAMIEFRRLLFARIVPNVKRLGLLTPWLRERFDELGILQYEALPADG